MMRVKLLACLFLEQSFLLLCGVHVHNYIISGLDSDMMNKVNTHLWLIQQKGIVKASGKLQKSYALQIDLTTGKRFTCSQPLALHLCLVPRSLV